MTLFVLSETLLLAIVGALFFCFSKSGKLSEMGKWLYIVSILWLVHAVAGHLLRF